MDRTKALYGPRTQASGETNYLEEKLQVLDRTKALYGPRTQVSGETNYLEFIVLGRSPRMHYGVFSCYLGQIHEFNLLGIIIIMPGNVDKLELVGFFFKVSCSKYH